MGRGRLVKFVKILIIVRNLLGIKLDSEKLSRFWERILFFF